MILDCLCKILLNVNFSRLISIIAISLTLIQLLETVYWFNISMMFHFYCNLSYWKWIQYYSFIYRTELTPVQLKGWCKKQYSYSWECFTAIMREIIIMIHILTRKYFYSYCQPRDGSKGKNIFNIPIASRISVLIS